MIGQVSIGACSSVTDHMCILVELVLILDAKGLEVTQHFVTSKDGTRVPYFQVARKDLALDGSTPTIIEGYGGFEVALTPGYSPIVGAAWLEKGGAFVVPNLRGGGEYGPKWHEAATLDPRRPRPSRPRAQDGCAHARATT
jgi:prolyl oligopeptidase